MNGQKISGELTTVEAQNKLFKLIQKEAFSHIKDERLRSLSAFEDSDGLIRLKKMTRGLIEEISTFQLLPSNHPVVHGYIKYKHEENSHVQGLLSVLKEDIWIISGRRTVKSVIDKCIKCKRCCVKSLDTEPVPLPPYRVQDVSVFEVCGVDLPGPVFFEVAKRHGSHCLHVQCVYRAVHLELTTSLSADSFLQSLRRLFQLGEVDLNFCFQITGPTFKGRKKCFQANGLE